MADLGLSEHPETWRLWPSSLLAVVTSITEPEEQNDVAMAWIRLQCLGGLVHQAQ